MHCNTLKQDNDSIVRGDGGSRVGEVRAGTTSPMPEHKGFKLQQLSRDPLTPADGPGSVSVNDYKIKKKEVLILDKNAFMSWCSMQYSFTLLCLILWSRLKLSGVYQQKKMQNNQLKGNKTVR